MVDFISLLRQMRSALLSLIREDKVAGLMEKNHAESPDKGYRRIRDDLERYHGTKINDKRALRI